MHILHACTGVGPLSLAHRLSLVTLQSLGPYMVDRAVSRLDRAEGHNLEEGQGAVRGVERGEGSSLGRPEGVDHVIERSVRSEEEDCRWESASDASSRRVTEGEEATCSAGLGSQGHKSSNAENPSGIPSAIGHLESSAPSTAAGSSGFGASISIRDGRRSARGLSAWFRLWMRVWARLWRALAARWATRIK